MSTVHKTFGSLGETAFKAYAKSLYDGAHGDPRGIQSHSAYLQQVIASDDASIRADQKLITARRRLLRAQRKEVDAMQIEQGVDFSKPSNSPIFTAVTKTDAQIVTLLTTDNATVYLRGRTVTGNIRISGDNVKLIGLDATGSAVAGTLAHTAIVVTDKIEIGGDNIVLEGIHFKCSNDKAITFVGTKGVGLQLIDCTFESTHGTYADAMFYYGDGAGAGGSQKISNCRIKDFGSWLLGDATTSSAFGTTIRLEEFIIDKCKIDNCAGCFAVRGPATGEPNGTISFTDNFVEYGAGGIHASFWNNFEASEGISKVICTGNKVVGMVKLGDRGFLQCWSRNPVPWTLYFEKNELANFQAAVQIACNATFYAPNTQRSDYKIASEAGKITGTDYGASFVFPYDDATKTYAPENIAAEATEPSTSFADSLGNFGHA